eukprot:scaffold14195_cov48-Attheya_sp.AAC.2
MGGASSQMKPTAVIVGICPTTEETMHSNKQSRADKVLLSLSRTVLLEGEINLLNEKQTKNGYDFSGLVRQTDIQEGIFICAIGGLPLFSSLQLSPTTSSLGWLSFSFPISDNHILHIQPKEGAVDTMMKVICAKSKCHRGH